MSSQSTMSLLRCAEMVVDALVVALVGGCSCGLLLWLVAVRWWLCGGGCAVVVALVVALVIVAPVIALVVVSVVVAARWC